MQTLCSIANLLVSGDREAEVILSPLSGLLDELAQGKADAGGSDRLSDGDGGTPTAGCARLVSFRDRHSNRLMGPITCRRRASGRSWTLSPPSLAKSVRSGSEVGADICRRAGRRRRDRPGSGAHRAGRWCIARADPAGRVSARLRPSASPPSSATSAPKVSSGMRSSWVSSLTSEVAASSRPQIQSFWRQRALRKAPRLLS